MGPQTTLRRTRFGVVLCAALGMVLALLGSAAVTSSSGAGRLTAVAVSALRTASVPEFNFLIRTRQVATVTVVNPSATPIRITGAPATAVDGGGANPWQVVPGAEDCTGAILQPVTGYCVVTLQFISTSTNTFVSGNVRIAAADGTVTAFLSASDVPLNAPGVAPESVDFGNVNVGGVSPAHQVTVDAAPSSRPFQLMSVSAVDTPAKPGDTADYQNATDACTGARLTQPVPGQVPGNPNCQIGETASPAAAGKRPAFLDITYCDPDSFDFGSPPGGGSEVPLPPPAVPPGQELVCGHGDGFLFYAPHLLVSLTSTGVAITPPPPSTFTPTLVANPPLAPAGRTTEVTGTGFPDNAKVTFALVPVGTAPTIDLNTVPGVTNATTNGVGTFTSQILVLMPHTAPRGYEILAIATPVSVATPFLVTPGTEQPPKFVDRH